MSLGAVTTGASLAWKALPLLWKLGIVAGLALAAYGSWEAFLYHQRSLGAQEERTKEMARTVERQGRTIEEARRNAGITEARLQAQKRNQDAQNEELARARADALRDHHDLDELREQNAGVARAWRDRLAGDSPSRADVAAAADTIGVCADVLGRADRRASLLAEVADARGAAGLKCERDYDSLTTAKEKP